MNPIEIILIVSSFIVGLFLGFIVSFLYLRKKMQEALFNFENISKIMEELARKNLKR